MIVGFFRVHHFDGFVQPRIELLTFSCYSLHSEFRQRVLQLLMD